MTSEPTPERPWRIVVSLAASALACVLPLFSFGASVPALWEMVTFTPRGPIRLMVLPALWFLGLLGFWFGGILIAGGSSLSRRPVAEGCGLIAVLVLGLPAASFALFWVIFLARGLTLGD